MLAAVAAAAFNLLCQGTRTTFDASDLQAALAGEQRTDGSKYKMEYRVDLDRGRWCYDLACDESFPIAKMSDVQLTLQEDYIGTGTYARQRYISVNRETGSYEERRSNGAKVELVRGTCQRRPSPGLPKLKF